MRQFFSIFSKTVQKGRKAQKQSFQDLLGTRRSRNFKKKEKKRKLVSLGKSLGNFLEKYIWMSSSVVKLKASLQHFQ